MDLQLTPEEIAKFNQRRPVWAQGSVCHAPSQSLYFGMRGEVMVCCANRSHLAGRYPEQSIMECWTSQTTQKVRAALTTGDMSLGCKGCYELIRGGNYANLPGGDYDHMRPNPKGWPNRMDFELTNTCNLECVTCRGELSSAIRRNRDKLPPIPSPYDDAFVRQLEEFIPHLQKSYFAGGEPFLINPYLEIWDRMAKLNPGHQLSIQTNGTILTDRIKQLLENLRVSLAVSMDSVFPDRFESIRVNAKWDTVRGNLDYLLAYAKRKGTQVTLSYTPMTLNWMELPDAIAFCNGLGIHIFFNNLSFPRRLAFSSLSADQLAEIVRFLGSYEPPRHSAVAQANARAYTDLYHQIQYWHREAQQMEVESMDQAILVGEDYYSAFRQYVGTHFPPEKAAALAEEVPAKLQYVIGFAEEKGMHEAVWKHMATVEFEMLCTYIPGKTEAELLAAFETALLGS